MRYSKPVRLETAPTGPAGNAGRLETAPTVLPFGRHCFQLCLCGAVKNRTYRVGVNAGRLETEPTGPAGNAVRLETEPTVLPFGRHCFQLCLCGAVRNRTYRVGVNAVRLETAPTGPDKSGSKPRGGGVDVWSFRQSTDRIS